MKILLISQKFFPSIGGSEQVILNLAKYLSDKNEVTIYTTNAFDLESFWNKTGKTIQNDNTKFEFQINRYEITVPAKVPEELSTFQFAYGIPGPFSPDMWNDLLKFGKNFDLIIASSFPYNHIIPAYFISKKYKIPLVVIPHIHLQFPEIYLTGLRLAILKNSDLIIVNTLTEKKTLLSYNIDEKKINVVPPSIDIDYWGSDKIKPSNTKISNSSKIVLFAGLRSKEKGIFFLIESLKKLWKKKLDIKLILIGPTTKEFQNYFYQQNDFIKNKIIDKGIVDDSEKKLIFNQCDFFILPSITESFGISYSEAWICEKPVIACNVEPVNEIISDKVNGLLVDFENEEQLSSSIENLISNPSVCENLGKKGKLEVISNYDLKKNMLLIEKLCCDLI